MTLRKTLPGVITTALLATLFIPFIVASSQFFPYITGKAFVFRIGMEIIFGLWLVLAVRDRRYAPRFSWILAAVTLFVVIIGIADFFGVNPYKSFWSNYERMEGFITIAHLFMYFLVASSVLNAERLWNIFLNTSVFSSLIMCFYGFLQLAGKMQINQGGVRLDGTMGNAIYLAVYMLFNIFFAIFLFVRASKTNPWRYGYIAIVVLQLVILYNTATRGVILGLIGGALLTTILVALFEKENKKIRTGSIATLIALCVVVGGFWLARESDAVQKSPVLQRFASLSLNEIKTQGRYYIWPMAIEGFKERPILGWGQEGFSYVFNKNYNPAMYAQEPWFDRTHNLFLDWLIAGGALGLLSYFGILFFLVYYLFRSSLNVREKAIMCGLIAAYIFQGIFVFDNLMSYVLFFSLVAFVHEHHVRVGNVRVSSWLESGAKSETVQNTIFVAVVAITIFTAYFFNVKPILANRELLLAIDANRSTPAESVEHFKNIFAKHTFGSSEAAEQMMFNLSRFQSSEISAEVKQAYAMEMITQFENQIKKTPNDTRYLLFLGSSLNRIQHPAEAIPVLQKALETSPKKQQILFELGLSYLNNGDKATALSTFKQAYDLAPDFSDARLLYGIGAIYNKDLKLADSLFSTFKKEELALDERIIGAYAAIGEFGRALEFLKIRTTREPENPQLAFSLAAAYLKVGNRTLAIAELRRIAEIAPSVKNQADYYIKEIQAGRNP